MAERRHRSIGEVVELLENEFPDITISKVRFLEAQGLVCPERAASGYRRFHDKDLAQLRWVLRQQRDHFLPLRVIRQRLSMRQPTQEELDADAAPAPLPRVNPAQPPDRDLQLGGRELAQRSGLSVDQLAAMEKFGLLSPRSHRGRPVYNADDLIAAQLVARFLAHGIEPRHLRPFKVAAEREAALIGQRLAAVNGVEATSATISELVELGADLRALLLRRLLHHETG